MATGGHWSGVTRRWAAGAALVGMVGSALIGVAPEAKAGSTNLAAAFTNTSRVVTGGDFGFADFYAGNHTVMARFLPQYPRASEQPIVSNSTGTYKIGLGDWITAGRRTALRVTMGNYNRLIPVNGLTRDVWHTVAVTRTNNANGTTSLATYFDGVAVRNETVTLGGTAPTGAVYVGRASTADPQFHGLVDDLAFYNAARGATKVKALHDKPRLDGSEQYLKALFTFDGLRPDGSALTPVMSRSFSTPAPTTLAIVSEDRNSAYDRTRVALPFNVSATRLPFAPGVAWTVIQGYASDRDNGSHYGQSAFSFDFTRTGVANKDTCKQKVFSVAAGDVLLAGDDGDPNPTVADPNPTDPVDLIDGHNSMNIRHNSAEVAEYLHLLEESMDEAMPAHGPFGYAADGDRATPFPVTKGQWLARVGNRPTGSTPDNCHLHLAVKEGDRTGTLPIAFDNYERQRGDGTWEFVRRGIPAENEVVRNTPQISIVGSTSHEPLADPTYVDFTVSLDAKPKSTVTVAVETQPGTASTADYGDVATTLTFPAGTQTKTVRVPVAADDFDEYTESVLLRATAATGAHLPAAAATGYIKDIDGPPALTVDNPVFTELDPCARTCSGLETLRARVCFTFTLAGASGKNISVGYVSADGPSPAATAGSDYNAMNSSVTIVAGETQAAACTATGRDNTVEPDEKFTLKVTPTNATFAGPNPVATIQNDD